MLNILIKHNLNQQEKMKLFSFKDQFLNFGLQEQKLWFKKNINKNDIHIFLKKKKKLLLIIV